MTAELWVPPSATLHKKADPPKIGEAFGHWAGNDRTSYITLPGGGVLQFDLSKLTLADFRSMRDHYQINASLSVLSFMMHRVDWKIEGPDKKICDFVTDNVSEVWTRLIRAMSQAYWAGYAPTVIQWENDVEGKRIVATKFKDLVPEDCHINWKVVEGWAPPNELKPKYKIYDGIKQRGLRFPIPVENTLWYPLLMENGDHYGKKLLRPAFPSWFFSILIHLFVNRYFERFGEPMPVGRADYEQEVEINGQAMNGRDAMALLVNNIRSRAVTVLPSTRDPETKEFDFDIEYLESQMRGADFERYLTRLDEEMSVGLFTPLMLMRSGDVGSYNLGVSQMQMYMWMLNALAGDLAEYINKYYVQRLVGLNFSPKVANQYHWRPRQMGNESVETVRAILQELIRGNKAKPDLDELGQIAGLKLSEIKEVTAPLPNPAVDPNADPNADPNDPNAPAPADDRIGRPERKKPRRKPRGVGEPRATGKQIAARIAEQVDNAYKNGTFGVSFQPSLGYRKRFEESLKAEGADSATAYLLTNDIYTRMEMWLDDVVALGIDEFPAPEDFMGLFNRMLESEVDLLAAPSA